MSDSDGPWTIGDVGEYTFESKYLECWDDAPGKVIYAEDSDRMKSDYEYYVFDKAAFVAKFGAADKGGSATIKITNITNDVSKVDNPAVAQPEGGFSKTFYACEIVE